MQGHEVRSLSRRASSHKERVDVLSAASVATLGGASGVVYCAWDTADRSQPAQTAHVRASARWARESAALNVPFILTSTVLAGAGATSSYGQHKTLAEQEVSAAGGVSLRIGLVVEDAYPFLGTRLRRLGERMPMAARLLDVPVYAVGAPTVGRAVVAELAAPRGGVVVWLAPDLPCSLRDVVQWGAPGARALGQEANGGGLLRLGARLPVRNGLLGRYVDALQGVLATPERAVEAVLPADGPVPADSWQESLGAPGA